LLDVRKKFAIFNEVKVVAKKVLNKAIKKKLLSELNDLQ